MSAPPTRPEPTYEAEVEDEPRPRTERSRMDQRRRIKIVGPESRTEIANEGLRSRESENGNQKTTNHKQSDPRQTTKPENQRARDRDSEIARTKYRELESKNQSGEPRTQPVETREDENRKPQTTN
ncbi:hypothetical protein U1Q18_030909 [Sarracenia purpurea var. burkii]